MCNCIANLKSMRFCTGTWLAFKDTGSSSWGLTLIIDPPTIIPELTCGRSLLYIIHLSGKLGVDQTSYSKNIRGCKIVGPVPWVRAGTGEFTWVMLLYCNSGLQMCSPLSPDVQIS